MSNHLQISLQRKHFFLSYFKTLDSGPARVELTTSRTERYFPRVHGSLLCLAFAPVAIYTTFLACHIHLTPISHLGCFTRGNFSFLLWCCLHFLRPLNSSGRFRWFCIGLENTFPVFSFRRSFFTGFAVPFFCVNLLHCIIRALLVNLFLRNLSIVCTINTAIEIASQFPAIVSSVFYSVERSDKE